MAVQAVQAETPAATPAAQVVGNAFVEQYYHILHQSPELVYRFYQDSSVLSRPDSSGAMCSATTMQEINERILSLTCKDFLAEIKTADAQNSLGDGVTVLVTGYLTETNSVKRKFAQSFFLAPQEKGYYVLNDVFRYVEEDHLTVPVPAAITENVPAAIQTPEPEPLSLVADFPEQVHEASNEEDLTNEPEVCDPSDIKDRSITKAEVTDAPLTHLDQSENVTITPVPSSTQVEEPKKSYASILKAMMANPSPMSGRVPAGDVKTRHPSSNREASGFAKPAQVSEAAASRSETGPGKIDALEEDYSIYVRNLPQNATAAQVEEVFEKFGPLKQGGVQVRSNKQGFCFGFVEFQSPSPMKSAIEASPILIGGRKATVEEKKTTGRAAGNPNNGRGRYPSSRGGSRTDSFRGRAGFTGGRGYGRNDSRGPGEYSSRPRGPSGRGSESYQRADQNGAGNGGHQGEL